MASGSVNKIVCGGGLFLARNTKRFLFLLRTQGKTAGTWGLVGGKKEPHDSTLVETLRRECQEEIGRQPEIRKIIPLELFTSNDQHFQFNTYVLIIDEEFVPVLNEEHAGYAWCNYGSWPMPLHQGVKNTFHNKTIATKLELLLELIDELSSN